MHILVDRYIPQAWISEAWQAVGGGKIVFITQVDIHRVGVYLSKYLTKELLLADLTKRQRRYSTSRDITLFVQVRSGDWTVIKAPLEFLYWQVREAVRQEHYDDEEGVLEWFELSGATPGPLASRQDGSRAVSARFTMASV